MNSKIFARTGFWVMTAAMAVTALSAQTPAGQAPPAGQPPAPQGRGGGRGGLPPVVSPEVNADKSVTLRFRAPNAKEVTRHRRARWQDLPDDEERRRRLGGQDRAAGAGRLQLPVQRRRRRDDGSDQPVGEARVRRLPAGEHVRDPRRRVRRCEGCPAWDGARRDLSLEDARRAAHALDLYAARLRARQHALSGLLPAARRRQHRLELDAHRPRQLHHGQPDRGGQSQADDHRQSRSATRAWASAPAPSVR